MKSKPGGKKRKTKITHHALLITHYESPITHHGSTDHTLPIADRDTMESPVKLMVKELKEF